MTKSFLLYDLAELPKGMKLDDVIKQYKEKNIILTDSFNSNGKNPINSKVITIEVTEDEIEEEVNKRVSAKIEQFCNAMGEQMKKKESIVLDELRLIVNLAEKELTNKK